MPRKLDNFPKELSSYPLDAAELGALGAARWEYEDGDYVVREGEADQDFFILEHGSIVVEKQGGDRAARPLVLNATLYQRGHLIAFGEVAYCVGGVRTASVRSTGRSIVLRLPPSAVSEIFKRHPAMAEELFKLLAEHLRRTSEELRSLQARLVAPSEPKNVPAGTVLFEPGAKAETLYQCLRGKVRLKGGGASRDVGPGVSDADEEGLIDLPAYLAGGLHSCRAVCLTDGMLLVYGPEARAGVLHMFPEAVLRALAAR